MVMSVFSSILSDIETNVTHPALLLSTAQKGKKKYPHDSANIKEFQTIASLFWSKSIALESSFPTRNLCGVVSSIGRHPGYRIWVPGTWRYSGYLVPGGTLGTWYLEVLWVPECHSRYLEVHFF